MKKNILIALILYCFTANAQEFHGQAEYITKRVLKNGIEDLGIKSDTDADMKKAYEEAWKKASEQIFILTFNKKEALYEKQQVLEKPLNQCGGVNVTIHSSGQGKKYINIQEQLKMEEDDILLKEYLIVEKLETLEWKLLDESKKIGEYICYKAELIIPVAEKQKKEYEEYLKKQETKPSFFSMDEPKEKIITAWFTPEIPVSFGPANYWGLPGLILELNDQNTMILCAKVILSKKENTKIKVPNNGTKVSQEEFEAIHKDKMDSIEERD